jgi:hypothetical protein
VVAPPQAIEGERNAELAKTMKQGENQSDYKRLLL